MRLQCPLPFDPRLLALLLAGAAAPAAPENWVAAWATAPADAGVFANVFQAPGGLRNRSVRNVVHCSIGGQAVRLRLSNALGSETVVFDEVYAGRQSRGAALVQGSNRAVTFGGSKRVAVPAGAVALSDPVAMAVSPAGDLAVSLYTASAGGAVTSHPAAYQDSYVSTPGNFAGNENGSGFTTAVRSWFFLSAVDVRADARVRGTIVAFGDSITDGDGSSINADKRWPDVLARRIAATGGAFSVVNAGIAGNRVLTNSSCFGAGALARLERDVFSQAAIRAVILLEGVNDLNHPEVGGRGDRIKPCVDVPRVSADDLIAGYRQIAAQVHARGLRIYAGTVLPFRGLAVWIPASEAKRQAINKWMKSSGVFDGVIDFAGAVADPGDPSMLARGKDSGDHIHPNDAGYAAMGNAIDLATLASR